MAGEGEESSVGWESLVLSVEDEETGKAGGAEKSGRGIK
jgi:hypothetical protein